VTGIDRSYLGSAGRTGRVGLGRDGILGIPGTRTGDDEARAIQWSIWAMTEAEPPVMEVLVNRAFLPEPQRDESKAKAGEARLQKPAGVLDGQLAGREYLLGSRFTVADLNVHAVLGWVTTLGKMSFPTHPNLSRWLATCGKRPALGRVFKR
jgi:glutathione S-transferase